MNAARRLAHPTTALALILTLALAVSGAGCRPKLAGEAAKVYALSDTELIGRYIEGLDIAVGDDLLFTDPATIPSQTLLMFFCCVTDQNETVNSSRWIDQEDGQFHIPLSEIETTVRQYLGDKARLDPTQITGYDAVKREVVTPIFAGFGGARFIKLTGKEIVAKDTFSLTAGFYDESYKTLLCTKVYTIRVTDTGYQYLSIVMK